MVVTFSQGRHIESMSQREGEEAISGIRAGLFNNGLARQHPDNDILRDE